MRMREYSESIPKPMVLIGYRPILWHVMKYYAHFGHKDFILCLGYRADAIKSYFLQYDECLSNDFILEAGGRRLDLLTKDIEDWKITFVDTGLNANVGQRLKAVEEFLEGEEMFLANYTDGLADVPLPQQLKIFRDSGKIACFASVKPRATFHLVEADAQGVVHSIEHIRQGGARVNGGGFIFRKDIFRYVLPGEELVEEPFRRLIREQQLLAFRHDGFWACMDTFKEKQELEDMFARGEAPWVIWNGARNA